MSLTRIKLKSFTAFKSLDVALGPGINVFIGRNGTGKTHLLKIAYSACKASLDESFPQKLVGSFLPYQGRLGRLAHRRGKSTTATVKVFRGDKELSVEFSNHTKEHTEATVTGREAWASEPLPLVYIPVKEMLANAPGFRSMYAKREVHFEEVYADIIDNAYLPILRGRPDAARKALLDRLQQELAGWVSVENETFFLKNDDGELEFTLLAEGMRKLGLLWLLIQNGALLKGSVLAWDEPETNMNPALIGTLVDVLLELQRMGVQILLATHDYVLLKEFDLRAQKQKGDAIRFHSLYRDDESGEIWHSAADEYALVDPNAISQTFLGLYDRDVERELGDG